MGGKKKKKQRTYIFLSISWITAEQTPPAAESRYRTSEDCVILLDNKKKIKKEETFYYVFIKYQEHVAFTRPFLRIVFCLGRVIGQSLVDDQRSGSLTWRQSSFDLLLIMGDLAKHQPKNATIFDQIALAGQQRWHERNELVRGIVKICPFTFRSTNQGDSIRINQTHEFRNETTWLIILVWTAERRKLTSDVFIWTETSVISGANRTIMDELDEFQSMLLFSQGVQECNLLLYC